MYWTAKVIRLTGDKYDVQYDHGDRELVLGENVSPSNPPFKFGEEIHDLQVRDPRSLHIASSGSSRCQNC